MSQYQSFNQRGQQGQGQGQNQGQGVPQNQAAQGRVPPPTTGPTNLGSYIFLIIQW